MIDATPVVIDPGEAALVVIGLSNVLKRDVPKIGVEKLREIGRVGKDVSAKARDLVAGKLRGKPIPREHSYRALLDRLSRNMSPEEIQGLVDRFPPEASAVSGPFLLVVQQAVAHLKQIFPTSEYVTFTGPRSMTPPDDAVFEFFNRLLVLNAPLVVFDLMASGALLPSQALAVQEFFPTLSKAIKSAVYDAVTKAKAAKASYRLPSRVTVGLDAWLGNPTTDYQPNAPRVVPTPKRPGALNDLSKLAANAATTGGAGT